MHIEIRGAEKLSFRERQVVVLKEMGKTTEEITRNLKISASTVATLFNRARAKGYEVVIVLPGDSLGILGGEDEDLAEE
ncbi:MAG: sigma factor-like helix-turn-helix DNA-binding protein [Bacillota bacterium]|nr:sigma factor-like helix-turn-helix DNA-binding protein [Bacillota bacterium]